MEILHLIITLIIIILILDMMITKPAKNCKTMMTRDGTIVEICASHENFDIPLDPKALCESRCQTNFDHAQLQAKGILVENCIRQCNNL